MPTVGVKLAESGAEPGAKEERVAGTQWGVLGRGRGGNCGAGAKIDLS